MRDIVLLAIIFGSVPVCIMRPHVGILFWAWVSYMNPHRLAWGVATNFPVAQVVALATLVGVGLLFIQGKRLPLPMKRETVILLMLWGMFTLSSVFAMRSDWAWPEWQEVSKTLLVTFLTMVLINDPRRLRYLIIVIALSLGFYGLKGGVFSILTGGQYKVWGPSGSFITDNNALALALNMTLPLLFYLSKTEQRALHRWGYRAVFGLTALSVIFSYSRGGFLGLSVVLGLIVMKSGIKAKIFLAIVVVLAAPATLTLIPDKWFARMNTISDYEEDDSAMTRIAAWKVATHVAMDHPLTGGGFKAIDNSDLYAVYKVESSLRTGVHSIYFQVLGEHGFTGLSLFLALLASAILSLRKLRKTIRGIPELQALRDYSHMFEVGLCAYAVSGAFLELATFDLFYEFVAITVIMKSIAHAALRETARESGTVVSRQAAAPA